MEELNGKIKNLSRYKIEYFLNNPQATKVQFLKEIKERIATLVQEIPLSTSKAQIAYFTGKILNINPDFDQNAVEALNKALKLDVNNHNSLIELGKLYWKKQDVKQALTCFEQAVQKSEEPRSFCYYAAALRNEASMSGNNKRDQLIKIKESIDLSKKATELDPNYRFAWYSLGNSYLCRFFITAQLDPKDLDRSIDSFNRALQQQSPAFINPDLHVNYAEALIYKQDYPTALTNLTRAIEIEPHFDTAIERLDLLRTFLYRLNDCISKKGKLPAKKIKEMVNSIDHQGYVAIYPEHTYSSINDLTVGSNPNKFVCLKIVSVVSHSNQIPFAMIGVDNNETFFGLTVFNFSHHFKALVGDFYVVPAPILIELTDVRISEDIMLSIKLIRVDEPQSLCRNGSKLGPEFKAITNVRFGLK